MARQKGTLGLASNIEPSMNAPLDARETVALIADLTASGSFTYFYEGMKVYCREDKKTYTLIGSDPTVSANWSAATGGDGATIKDANGPLDYQDNIQLLGDFDVTENTQDNASEVRPHRMTQNEWNEVFETLPGTGGDGYKVIFDETNKERKIGYYIFADGTKKPVYERSFIIQLPSNTTSTFNPQGSSLEKTFDLIANIPDIDKTGYFDYFGMANRGNHSKIPMGVDYTYTRTNNLPYLVEGFFMQHVDANFVLHIYYADFNSWSLAKIYVTFRYTKTTDTPA